MFYMHSDAPKKLKAPKSAKQNKSILKQNLKKKIQIIQYTCNLKISRLHSSITLKSNYMYLHVIFTLLYNNEKGSQNCSAMCRRISPHQVKTFHDTQDKETARNKHQAASTNQMV